MSLISSLVHDPAVALPDDTVFLLFAELIQVRLFGEKNKLAAYTAICQKLLQNSGLAHVQGCIGGKHVFPLQVFGFGKLGNGVVPGIVFKGQDPAEFGLQRLLVRGAQRAAVDLRQPEILRGPHNEESHYRQKSDLAGDPLEADPVLSAAKFSEKEPVSESDGQHHAVQLHGAVQDDVGLVNSRASEKHEEDHGAAAVSVLTARKQRAYEQDQQQ